MLTNIITYHAIYIDIDIYIDNDNDNNYGLNPKII